MASINTLRQLLKVIHLVRDLEHAAAPALRAPQSDLLTCPSAASSVNLVAMTIAALQKAKWSIMVAKLVIKHWRKVGLRMHQDFNLLATLFTHTVKGVRAHSDIICAIV